VKIECPNCHALFRVVTEEKELIEDEKAEDVKEGIKGEAEEVLEVLNPLGAFTRHVPGSFGKEEAVDDLTYEYRFKCKHCGHEWTELREREKVSKD
jgi:hypothetical protein